LPLQEQQIEVVAAVVVIKITQVFLMAAAQAVQA